MNKKILLFGSGGHCKSVLDSLLELNEYNEIGIIDKKENLRKSVINIPIIGSDEDLGSLYKDDYKYAFIAIGSESIREKLFNLVIKAGFEIPIIMDASAKVSVNASVEKGVFIGKNSVVNSGAVINKGAIINSGAIIEHDCNIGEFSHISPGAVLAGEVTVGKSTKIGLNASVREHIVIGDNTIVGMGSVVLQNISSNVVAYGNPCREVKKQ